jgi:hypothetical protein
MWSQTRFKLEGLDDCDHSNNTQTTRLERHGEDCSTVIRGDEPPDKIALTMPLSVCTASLSRVSARDIAGWVARSASVRHREVRQRKGHTARPLNSFMLYRSAYINRARAWCRQNKEQVLSQVIAASWKMEPTEVRQCYERYANIERSNHAKAHPTYKFSPRRAKLADPKKKKPSLQERCSEHPRDSRSLSESEEENPSSTSVNRETDSNMADCLTFSDTGLAMHSVWQPKPLETSMALSQYQSQQCYKSEGDQSIRYHAEQASHAVTAVTANSRDPSVSHYTQVSTYYCMCFSCMCKAQSTLTHDDVYNSCEYGPAVAMMPQAPPGAFPVYDYSTSSGYHKEYLSRYRTITPMATADVAWCFREDGEEPSVC